MRKNIKTKIRQKINEQEWIIKVFAIIGAGAILYLTASAIYKNAKFFYEYLTREQKTIIIIHDNEPEQPQSDEKAKEDTKHKEENKDAENEVLTLIKKEFGEDWRTAYAVAMAESRLNPRAIGDTHLEKPSFGLFQISKIYHNYTTEELLSAEKNIKIAKTIQSKGRGWENWTTYRNGYYKQFLK